MHDEVSPESERDDGGDDADDDHGSLDPRRLALPLQAERALIHRHDRPRVVRVYTHLLRLHRLENKTHSKPLSVYTHLLRLHRLENKTHNLLHSHLPSQTRIFLHKIFGGHMSIYGATDTSGLLVMSPLGFNARVSSLIYTWQRCILCIVHFLKFISGATPADLLTASMVASCCFPHACFSRGRMPGLNRRPLT